MRIISHQYQSIDCKSTMLTISTVPCTFGVAKIGLWRGSTQYSRYLLCICIGNKKKALDLYLQSAEKDNYKAQNNVGQFFEHGIGTEIDLEKAREYYRLSAQSDKSKGYPEENLGLLELRCGNKDEALRWLQKAVDKGNVSMKPYIWYIGRKETWVDK